MSIYYGTIRSLTEETAKILGCTPVKEQVSYNAEPEMHNAGNDYSILAKELVDKAQLEIRSQGVFSNDDHVVSELQFENNIKRACHYSYDKEYVYLCIHGINLEEKVFTDFIHALMKREPDTDPDHAKNLQHYMAEFQENGHFDDADWRVLHESLLLMKKASNTPGSSPRKVVFLFMQLCQNFPRYPEGHHDSNTAVDIYLTEGISRQDYRYYQTNLDPTLDSRYEEANRLNCFRCSCCPISRCLCGFPYPSGCIRFRCLVPDRCQYFVLILYICLISFLLESDFAALVYFLSAGSLSSDSAVENVLSVYSLCSFLLCYLGLLLTVGQCSVCYCGSSNDETMFAGDEESQELVGGKKHTLKPWKRCACPVMTLGPADTQYRFESTAARLLNLRVRWFMLMPFARMLFIIVAFGNIDWQLRSKTAEQLRQEKTTAFRAIAVLGMVNCLTLTVPNIVISALNIFNDSDEQRRNATMDFIFFCTNCLSLTTTIISMCFGFLNAVVYKIDSMDAILNDVAETQDRQLRISKYSKSHLKDLNDINQEIYMNLAVCDRVYCSDDASKDEFELKQMGARIANWESLASKLRMFIPEDQAMHSLKAEILQQIHILGDFAANGGFEDTSSEDVKGASKKLEVLLYKLEGRIRSAAVKYVEDLEVSCRITGTNFKSIAKSFQPFLEDYKKFRKFALKAVNGYTWAVDDVLDKDHHELKVNCKKKA